jgi:hypothetical protein
MVRNPRRYDRDDVEHEHDEMTHEHPQRVTTRRGERAAEERELETQRTVDWMPWSPAQLAALAGGLAFMVMGALAVIRGGFDDIQAHTSVWTFHHTTLMGLITIGFGALLAIAGAVPTLSRGLMLFLGVLALAWGIIVVAEPAAEFHDWLGVHVRNGWLYIIAGATILLVGLLAPIVMGSSRVYDRRAASRY